MGYKDAYHKYIKSDNWMKKRQERLEIDEWECAICSKHACALHVHHLTYDRLFDENANTDLITLCKRCHHYMDKIRKIIKAIDDKYRHRCFSLDKLLYIYGYPHDMKRDGERKHLRDLHTHLVSLKAELL